MKILVFSDSHGKPDRLEAAIRRVPADAAIHLGDGARDFETARERLGADFDRRMRFFSVRGNCDLGPEGLPLESEIVLGGLRFLILHGHTRRVKYGTKDLEDYARARGVDAVLYGHTHSADDRLLPGGPGKQPLRIFNPGSIGGSLYLSPHFGILEIRDGTLFTNSVLWEP